MPSAIALLLSLAAVSTAIKDSDPHHAWLLQQIAQTARSDDPATAAMSVVWRHELCAADAKCDEYVAANAETVRAYTLAARDAVLLTLFANTDSLASDSLPSNSARLLQRMRAVTRADPRNSYPQAIVAALHWRRGEYEAARTALIEAAAKKEFDDYYTENSTTAMRSIEAHPPTSAQLAPCTYTEDGPAEGLDQQERVMAATFSLMGSVGFSRLGDLVAMCKAVAADDSATDMQQACDRLGATMDSRAKTLLSRNMGIALRRITTRDKKQKAAYVQRLSDNDEEVQRGIWWTQKQSPVRAQASLLWRDALTESGEIAAAAALERKYGEPPESRTEREAREQRNMAAGVACCANLRIARAARAHARPHPHARPTRPHDP